MHRYLIAALALLAAGAAPAQPDWVAESNAYTRQRLELDARFNPEFAAQVGLSGHDERIIDLGPGYRQRYAETLRALNAEYRRALGREDDPRVRQDLRILIESGEENLATQALYEKHLIDYYNIPQLVFGSIRGLLDEQVDRSRWPAAVVRLKKYAGLAEGHQPLTELAVRHTAADLENPELLGPYVKELEKDLENSERFVEGVRRLFAESGLEGWEPAMAAYEQQVAEYRTWLEKNLKPRARADFRLPPELYAANLKNFGVDMAPGELIERASAGFMDIRLEMQALAGRIAAARGWKSADYRDVIRRLKQEQFTSDNILPAYRERLAEIEAIVRRHEIVSLPEREAVIRLASEAESAAQPAPHMQPPRMIGNTGERGEFVLPLNNPNADSEAKMDDFLNDAIAWTLTVHEARPGHEMQFAKMVENGVSQARMLYAFNSANVEGWALYAEAIMLPHLPPEGQLMSLQMRLLRAARMFLDPMLNLGRINYDQALAFLMNEVVLSEPMAVQEVDRYTFRAPGQATSYYYGHMKMQQLRAETELLLGDAFDQRAFHDFILTQGLLPPALMRKAVLEEFVPRHQ